jgi:hypothetical protein
MAEYLAVEKFCVHQAMSGVYVAEHVYSIDPDGLNRPLFQQPWNWGNSEHNILHQTDADVIHKKHLHENSEVHFHNYHKHKTGIIDILFMKENAHWGQQPVHQALSFLHQHCHLLRFALY